jgi:ATP-binding cassette, subfamily C (CFTR/MRP), member 1
VFSGIAKSKGGATTLDTARVFTSLSLFALLAEPLATMVMALTAFMGSVGSFVRIQTFLNKSQREDLRNNPLEFFDDLSEKGSIKGSDRGSFVSTRSDKKDSSFEDTLFMSNSLGSFNSSGNGHDAITVHGGAFGWDPSQEPLLKDIRISVPREKLTMIVGPVGCGKSTLLKALLGEVPTIAGSVRISSTSVAYCDQTPWHMNGTIQQGIIGMSHFDEPWYSTVIDACGLQADLKQLPNGDQTVIGSSGIALSGGQSQRLALARAIYAQRELIIIDDALSGLDANTENHVFHSLLGEDGLLRRCRATVLIAASSAKRVPYADHIIALSSTGRVIEQGNYPDLCALGGYISSFSLPNADWNSRLESPSTEKPTYTYVAPDLDKPSDDLQAEASRQTGDMSIYLYYIGAIGWWPTIIFMLAITAFVFCLSFPSKILFPPFSLCESLLTLLERFLGQVVGTSKRKRSKR